MDAHLKHQVYGPTLSLPLRNPRTAHDIIDVREFMRFVLSVVIATSGKLTAVSWVHGRQPLGISLLAGNCRSPDDLIPSVEVVCIQVSRAAAREI
jgi:hypothetical protein